MHPTVESVLVAFTFHQLFLLLFVASILYLYLLFCTSYFWIIVLYSFWIYVVDIDIGERGGRRSEFYRNLPIWKTLLNYFQHKMVLEPGAVLKADENYICASFPHGIMPFGASLTFITNGKKNFPQHTQYHLVQKALLCIPFVREYMLLGGSCCASKKSIRWLLNQPKKGKILTLMVGGAEESLYCRPGNYHIVLKNRKGFVKLALENDTPLVPVFTFGEIEVFDQILSMDSPLQKFQKTMIKYAGYALVWPIGCGPFGLIPRKVPLTTVVGRPIPVEKVTNPSNEQIDELHKRFTDAIKEIFEKNKQKYLKNHQDVSLIIH